MSGRLDLEKVVHTVEQVVRMFDAAVEILQAAQSEIPTPTLEEVAEVRRGERPLTQETYLLGLFQRAIVGAENLSSDLRAADLETLGNLHEIQLSGLEVNAIEEAITERKGKP